MSDDHEHVVVGTVTVHVADPLPGAGEIVAVYDASVPPFAAGAVHEACTAPSEGVRVRFAGASGQPLHGADVAVAADDTQAPSRALTVGVTALAGTVIDELVPDTPVATVAPEPSVTSYVRPAGGLATGVQETRHVVDAVRLAVAAVGT